MEDYTFDDDILLYKCHCCMKLFNKNKVTVREDGEHVCYRCRGLAMAEFNKLKNEMIKRQQDKINKDRMDINNHYFKKQKVEEFTMPSCDEIDNNHSAFNNPFTLEEKLYHERVTQELWRRVMDGNKFCG
jgi:hypothetical protein